MITGLPFVRAVSISISPEHPAFAGHFPGQPLLPGVALLAEVLEAVLDEPACATWVGAAPRIGAVKFLAPVRPGAQLTLHFERAERSLRFEVRDAGGHGERIMATGHFDPAR